MEHLRTALQLVEGSTDEGHEEKELTFRKEMKL